MSTGTLLTLHQVGEHIIIYVGFVMFIAGIIGGVLNIVVFLSLKTFRKKSSAFYLLVMSFVNIGNLMTGLLSRILISGFDIDWTVISSFYCKFRWYLLQFCFLTSFTCICLAAIDQYLSTCSRPQRRHWTNLKIAQILTLITIFTWLIHGILYLIYFDIVQSPITGISICYITNARFQQYHIYGFLIMLACILPVIVSGIFGLLARSNIKNSVYQATPIVRRYSEKQLTKIVLNQILYNFLFTSPYTVVSICTASMANVSDPNIIARLDFANVVTMLVYYISFACPFYVYICASERFRKQVMYVLFEVHFKRCLQHRMGINQVVPGSEENI